MTTYTVIRFWNPYGNKNNLLVQPVPRHLDLGRIEFIANATGRSIFTDCLFEDTYALIHLNDRASNEVVNSVISYLDAKG